MHIVGRYFETWCKKKEVNMSSKDGESVIGRQIRAFRLLRGWEQDELARRAGVSHSTVHRWEIGKLAPRYRSLVTLATLFGRPVGDVMSNTQLNGHFQIIGQTGARTWKRLPDFYYDETATALPLPEGISHLPVGFIIGDSTMNAVYPEGSVVLVEPVFDSIESGSRVLVARHGPLGMYELSVKDFERRADGEEWLHSRPTDPELEESVQVKDATNIIGRVVWSGFPEAFGAETPELPQ